MEFDHKNQYLDSQYTLELQEIQVQESKARVRLIRALAKLTEVVADLLEVGCGKLAGDK